MEFGGRTKAPEHPCECERPPAAAGWLRRRSKFICPRRVRVYIVVILGSLVKLEYENPLCVRWLQSPHELEILPVLKFEISASMVKSSVLKSQLTIIVCNLRLIVL